MFSALAQYSWDVRPKRPVLSVAGRDSAWAWASGSGYRRRASTQEAATVSPGGLQTGLLQASTRMAHPSTGRGAQQSFWSGATSAGWLSTLTSRSSRAPHRAPSTRLISTIRFRGQQHLDGSDKASYPTQRRVAVFRGSRQRVSSLHGRRLHRAAVEDTCVHVLSTTMTDDTLMHYLLSKAA
jgi:hypothetical protein